MSEGCDLVITILVQDRSVNAGIFSMLLNQINAAVDMIVDVASAPQLVQA